MVARKVPSQAVQGQVPQAHGRRELPTHLWALPSLTAFLLPTALGLSETDVNVNVIAVGVVCECCC